MKPTQYLRKASFDPQVRTYWLLSGALTLTLTIVGIPFLLLWFPIGLWATQRYLDTMECTLMPRSLKVKKGIFVRVEKTIPLDKITDMGMVQGPIMRAMNLETLSIETAGQSGAGGASFVALTGIVNAKAFREAVLDQRDKLTEKESSPTPVTASINPASMQTNALLLEIRNSLLRLETKLNEPKPESELATDLNPTSESESV